MDKAVESAVKENNKMSKSELLQQSFDDLNLFHEETKKLLKEETDPRYKPPIIKVAIEIIGKQEKILNSKLFEDPKTTGKMDIYEFFRLAGEKARKRKEEEQMALKKQEPQVQQALGTN